LAAVSPEVAAPRPVTVFAGFVPDHDTVVDRIVDEESDRFAGFNVLEFHDKNGVIDRGSGIDPHGIMLPEGAVGLL
jgi:hypothetical protein